MITKQRRLALAVGVIACGFLLAAAQVAEAVDFKIGGQVSRIVRFADDGVIDDTGHYDNAEAASRLTFTMSQLFGADELGDDSLGALSQRSARSSAESSAESIGIDGALRLWGLVEMSLLEDQDGVDEDHPDIKGQNSDEDLQLRRLAMGIETAWGELIAGRYDAASYGVARTDLSNSGLAVGNDDRNAAGIFYRDEVGGFQTFRIGEVVANYEAPRVNTIRLNSPTYRGCRGSVAAFEDSDAFSGTDKGQDAAIRCAKYYDGPDVDVAGGLIWQHYNGEMDVYGATASTKHRGTGLGLTGSYAEGDHDSVGRDDSDSFYVKGSWDFGPDQRTGIGVSYGETTDHSGNGVDGERIAVGVQHRIVEAGLDVFASWRQYGGDDNGSDFDDVDVIVTGLRLAF